MPVPTPHIQYGRIGNTAQQQPEILDSPESLLFGRGPHLFVVPGGIRLGVGTRQLVFRNPIPDEQQPAVVAAEHVKNAGIFGPVVYGIGVICPGSTDFASCFLSKCYWWAGSHTSTIYGHSLLSHFQ